MSCRNVYPVKLSPDTFIYWDDQREDLCDRNLLKNLLEKGHDLKLKLRFFTT